MTNVAVEFVTPGACRSILDVGGAISASGQSWQAPKAREVAYPLEGRIHRPRVLQARRVLLGPGVSCYLLSVNLSASRSTEQSIPRKAHGLTYQLPYRTTFLPGILRTLTIGGSG